MTARSSQEKLELTNLCDYQAKLKLLIFLYYRENGSSQYRSDNLELDSSGTDANGDLKRKQAEAASEEAGYQNNSSKNDEDDQRSPSTSSQTTKKRHKREKLDWSVLRPPKHQSKKN